MSLVNRYRLFWAALAAALLGLAFWKNSQSDAGKSWLWRLGKAVIDTGLVVLLAIYAPTLLLMYVVIWLTSPFRNKVLQVSAGFGAALAVTHIAGVMFESNRNRRHLCHRLGNRPGGGQDTQAIEPPGAMNGHAWRKGAH